MPDQSGWSPRTRRRPGRSVLLFLAFTVLLGGTFAGGPVAPVSADALSDAVAKQKALAAQIAKQKALVANLTRQQQALSASLAQTRASLSQVNLDLSAVRTEVVAATVDVARAQAEVDALDAQVAKLDLQLADLEEREARKLQELNARKSLLADRIRQAYDTDRTSLLETFLSGDTFTDVLAEVSYQLDFAQQDRELADQIVADQKVLAVLHQTVEDQAKINQIVKERARGGSIPSIYNGTLRWPMAGTITQEYGCTGFSWEPRRGNCAHFHKGIDIAAPLYTPIRAAAPGVVVFAGANPYDRYPKAWIVVIAHSSELVSWYAHVDNRAYGPRVKAGDSVVAGQIIAYEGLTGRTTGPHLHWMVEFRGSFMNPRLFL